MNIWQLFKRLGNEDYHQPWVRRQLKRALGYTLIEVLIGIMIIAVVIGLALGITLIPGKQSERKEAFIEECRKDGKKNYECEVLWGQANCRR